MKNLYILIVLCFLSQFSAFAQSFTLINDGSTLSGLGYYQLTSDSAISQGGGVYQNDSINLDSSFDYKFCVFLGCNGSSSSDGICFILSNNITGIGTNNGGGIGYSGLAGNSLAVEYDSWQNSWDPDNHHMAMEWGGQVEHPTGTIAGPVFAIPSGATMADCAWHTTELVWNVNTQTYNAYFDSLLRLTYTGDIVANFFAGNPIVNWGWSGTTGGGTRQQFCVLGISNGTGLAAVTADPDLSIFPNPNQGNFTVTISSPAMLNGTLSLVDQLGRTIKTQSIEVIGTREVPLELVDVSPGTYLIEINAPGARSIKQLTLR